MSASAWATRTFSRRKLGDAPFQALAVRIVGEIRLAVPDVGRGHGGHLTETV